MIKTKCVYSTIDRSTDGLRILATRGRGRGLKSSRYDVWMANLGPSEALMKGFRQGKFSWAEFVRRYRAELCEDGGVDRKNTLIKNHGQKFTLRLLQKLAQRGPVTLMCHCAENQQQCHRHVLAKVLKGKIG